MARSLSWSLFGFAFARCPYQRIRIGMSRLPIPIVSPSATQIIAWTSFQAALLRLLESHGADSSMSEDLLIYLNDVLVEGNDEWGNSCSYYGPPLPGARAGEHDGESSNSFLDLLQKSRQMSPIVTHPVESVLKLQENPTRNNLFPSNDGLSQQLKASWQTWGN